MKHVIQFELNKQYFDFGRQDAESGVFDSWYLDGCSDSSLSYLAGWKSATTKHNNFGAIIQTLQKSR